VINYIRSLRKSSTGTTQGGMAATNKQNRNGQFSKTKMCRFELLGMCTKGHQCPFAHGFLDLKPLPDLRCTKLCRELLQKGQCNTKNCNYAHSREVLRQGSSTKQAASSSNTSSSGAVLPGKAVSAPKQQQSVKNNSALEEQQHKKMLDQHQHQNLSSPASSQNSSRNGFDSGARDAVAAVKLALPPMPSLTTSSASAAAGVSGLGVFAAEEPRDLTEFDWSSLKLTPSTTASTTPTNSPGSLLSALARGGVGSDCQSGRASARSEPAYVRLPSPALPEQGAATGGGARPNIAEFDEVSDYRDFTGLGDFSFNNDTILKDGWDKLRTDLGGVADLAPPLPPPSAFESLPPAAANLGGLCARGAAPPMLWPGYNLEIFQQRDAIIGEQLTTSLPPPPAKTTSSPIRMGISAVRTSETTLCSLGDELRL